MELHLHEAQLDFHKNDTLHREPMPAMKYIIHPITIIKGKGRKGKVIPLQARCGPEAG